MTPLLEISRTQKCTINYSEWLAQMKKRSASRMFHMCELEGSKLGFKPN